MICVGTGRRSRCHNKGDDSACNFCVERELEVRLSFPFPLPVHMLTTFAFRIKREQCSYNPEDARGPTWSKMAVESHKQYESQLIAHNQTLKAEVDALRAHIEKLDPNGTVEVELPQAAKNELKDMMSRMRRLVVSPLSHFWFLPLPYVRG